MTLKQIGDKASHVVSVLEKEPPPTARQLRSTAHHEAGHAVIALALGVPLVKVTIERGYTEVDGLYAGLTTHWLPEVSPEQRRKDVGDGPENALVLLAGGLAEVRDRKGNRVTERLERDFQVGIEADIEMARAYAHYVGRDDPKFFNELVERSAGLVVENWHHIRKVAIELQKRGTLTGDEVWELITQ